MNKYNLNRIFRFEGIAFGIFMSSLLYTSIEMYRFYKNSQPLSEMVGFILIPIFLGAWVTLRGMSQQVNLSQQIEDERYYREERASKANLPIAASALMRLCETAIDYHLDPNIHRPDPVEFETNLKLFKESIRYSNEASGERLLGIIRAYQVLSARLLGDEYENRNSALNDTSNYLYNGYWNNLCGWATLRAQVEQVFDYARGNSQGIDLGPVNERVRSQFFTKIHSWGNYPILDELIISRSANNSFEMNFSRDM